MPKMVGITLEDSIDVSDWPCAKMEPLVCLTTAQARLLPSDYKLYRVLNTSDKGSKGTYAKRWWNYYASPADVLACPTATHNMIERAIAAIAAEAKRLRIDLQRLEDL